MPTVTCTIIYIYIYIYKLQRVCVCEMVSQYFISETFDEVLFIYTI